MRRSLLIGHVHVHGIVEETMGSPAPLHLSDERDRRDSMRQARVRHRWKARRQHRAPRLVCDEVGPTAAVPLQSVQGNAQHEHDSIQRSSLHSTGVRPGREPASRGREHFCEIELSRGPDALLAVGSATGRLINSERSLHRAPRGQRHVLVAASIGAELSACLLPADLEVAGRSSRVTPCSPRQRSETQCSSP